MNDFIYILQQAGLKFPGELIEQESEAYPSFTWTTKFDKPWTIRLIEDNHCFLITNGRDGFLYRIISDVGEKIALLVNHTIIRSEYEERQGRIETVYNATSFTKEVELEKLSIQIIGSWELSGRERKNHEAIDEYLLELDNCEVQKIFENLVKMLEIVPEEEVNLTVTFEKLFDRKVEFILKDGSYKSYAFLEDNKLYQLYSNGDWEYSDYSINVESYGKKSGFHIYDAESLDINPRIKFQQIEKRVSQLFELVNWN